MWVDLNGQSHEQALTPLESNQLTPHECLPTCVGLDLRADLTSPHIPDGKPAPPATDLR